MVKTALFAIKKTISRATNLRTEGSVQPSRVRESDARYDVRKPTNARYAQLAADAGKQAQ